MIWKPHMTVAALVERDGRFLMVEESINGQLLYNQPAGHLEDQESLLEAVVRETREETAWSFEPRSITGIYHWRQADSGDTFIRVSFAGRVTTHDPHSPLDEGIVRALWMEPGDIRRRAEYLRSPMVLRSIDDYLGGAAFPLQLVSRLD